MLTFSAFIIHHSAFCQQPQAQAGQDIFPVNAKYVQGFGPGYWPTAGASLTLNIAPGTAVCSNAVQTYAGGTLTIAANATSYVYLDPAHNCLPASNTTGFMTAAIPIATVITSASAITSVTDVRTLFVSNGMTTPGTVTSVGMSGDGIIFNASVPGSPTTSSGTFTPQLLTQSANRLLAGPASGPAATPSFRALAAADLPASIASNTTGNAATATALASAPTQCGSNSWASGIAATGNANCSQPGFSNLSGVLALGQTPLTTAGDILFANSAPALSRLAIGGTNQFLGNTGGLPAWIQPAFSNLGGTAAITQGGTGQTTAAAAFNALSPLNTEGDLHYYHSNSNARLPIGNNGQCLTSNGTDPVWGSCGNGGGGTVTSVGLSMPSIFTVSGSPISGAGTLAAGLTNQSANLVMAGPGSGSAAAPAFRSLVGADLPAPSTTTLGGVQSVNCGTNQFLNQISASGVPLCATPSGNGNTYGMGNGGDVIDATMFSGADMSAKINAALAQCHAVAPSCTLDARGFTGTQTMSVSVSASTGDVIYLPAAQINMACGTEFNLASGAKLHGSNFSGSFSGYGTYLVKTCGDTGDMVAGSGRNEVDNINLYSVQTINPGTFTFSTGATNSTTLYAHTGICVDASAMGASWIHDLWVACGYGVYGAPIGYETKIDRIHGWGQSNTSTTIFAPTNAVSIDDVDCSNTWAVCAVVNSAAFGYAETIKNLTQDNWGAGIVVTGASGLQIVNPYLAGGGAQVTTHDGYAWRQASYPYKYGDLIQVCNGASATGHTLMSISGSGGVGATSSATATGTCAGPSSLLTTLSGLADGQQYTEPGTSLTWLDIGQSPALWLGPAAVGTLVNGVSPVDDQTSNTPFPWDGGCTSQIWSSPTVVGVNGGTPCLIPSTAVGFGPFGFWGINNQSVIAKGWQNGGILEFHPSYGGYSVAPGANQSVGANAPYQQLGFAQLIGRFINHGENLVSDGGLLVQPLGKPPAPALTLVGSHPCNGGSIPCASPLPTYAVSVHNMSNGIADAQTKVGSFATAPSTTPSVLGGLLSVSVWNGNAGSGYSVNCTISLGGEGTLGFSGNGGAVVTVDTVGTGGSFATGHVSTEGNGYLDGWNGVPQASSSCGGTGVQFTISATDILAISAPNYGTTLEPFYSTGALDLVKDPAGGSSTSDALWVNQSIAPGQYPCGASFLSGYLCDAGQAYATTSYTSTTRDSTGDSNFNGFATFTTPKPGSGQRRFTIYDNATDQQPMLYVNTAGTGGGSSGVFTLNNTLDDSSGNMAAGGKMTASQFCISSSCITSLWSNPMTTKGDLLYGGSGGVATRLAGNSSTAPMYLKSVGSAGAATAPILAQIQFTDIGGTLGIGAGGTGQTTAAASFNALSPLGAEGDLAYYHSASNIRLAIGGANTFLTSNGTDPLWSSLTGAGFGTQTANSFLAAPNGSNGNPSFRALAAADLPASITSSTAGNAATATALASSPTQCSGNTWATGITPSGNGNCAQVGFSNLAGSLSATQLPNGWNPVTNANLQNSSVTINGQTCTLGASCSPLPDVYSTSNVLNQTAPQGAVTLASSLPAGSYRINIYADQNSGGGSTYFTFNWTDGANARSLSTGLLTLAGGYLSGLFPIYVSGGSVTYTSTVSGTVNYDVHITLERMQ